MLEAFDHSRRWVILVLLLLSHVYFLQIYPYFTSPNELSRVLLSSAIVDDHTITIDQAMRRYGSSQDRASFQGHSYSDKAIGTSLLGIPPLLLVRGAESIIGSTFTAPTTIFWMRLVTVTIPALLFVSVLARFWRQLKPQSRYIPHLLFLHLFGTITFTYANQFVSHYLLAISLLCSVFCLHQYRSLPEQPHRYIWGAGSFAGLSLLLEFPAVVPVAVIFVFAAASLRSLQKLIYFSIPILLSVLIVLGYNYAIFGTPWDVTYRHMTHSFHLSKHAEGVVGMGLPKPEALYGLLFSRHHGLFFISPFLLLSIPGFYKMIRIQEHSFTAYLMIAIVVSTVLTYSAFSYWMAGWNFGPLYLTPVVPFLSTAAFYFADEFLERSFLRRTLFAAAAIWSVLCVTISTITFPFPPDNLEDPVFFLNVPLLLNGATGKNLGGNVWLFFTLLGCTLMIWTFPKNTKKIVLPPVKNVLAPVFFALLLFVLAFLSRPSPKAMEYYARGSVYLYLGQFRQSLSEMELALAANPDENVRRLILKRQSDLGRVVKQ